MQNVCLNLTHGSRTLCLYVFVFLVSALQIKRKGKIQGKAKNYNDRLCRNRNLADPAKKPKRRQNNKSEDDVIEIEEPTSPIATTKMISPPGKTFPDFNLLESYTILFFG